MFYGEGSGILFKLKNMGPVETATTSFGQGISVTSTPYCLINDTITIIKGIASKYTKKYDVMFSYKAYINL